MKKEPFDEIRTILVWSITLTCLLLGILLLIVSVELINVPWFTTLTATRILGGIFLIVGTARLFSRIRSRSGRRGSLGLGIGVVTLVLGILLLIDPSLGSIFISLSLFLGIFLIGIMEVILALLKRHQSPWYWLLLSSILTINLNILVWVKFSSDFPLLLSWLVRLGLLAIGLFMLILAIYISRSNSN